MYNEALCVAALNHHPWTLLRRLIEAGDLEPPSVLQPSTERQVVANAPDGPRASRGRWAIPKRIPELLRGFVAPPHSQHEVRCFQQLLWESFGTISLHKVYPRVLGRIQIAHLTQPLQAAQRLRVPPGAQLHAPGRAHARQRRGHGDELAEAAAHVHEGVVGPQAGGAEQAADAAAVQLAVGRGAVAGAEEALELRASDLPRLAPGPVGALQGALQAREPLGGRLGQRRQVLQLGGVGPLLRPSRS
mmetsp:Transcript_50111/g.100898  ORF Transcript_50111/g.100898 Transcript_50111/m.100898 type:complete len:246 (+) Transcript_50111:126-863(+)